VFKKVKEKKKKKERKVLLLKKKRIFEYFHSQFQMGGSQSHVSDEERIQHLVEDAVRKEMEKRDLERKEEEEDKVQENKEVKKEEGEERVGERQQVDLRFVSLTRNSSIIDTPSRSVFSPYALPNSGISLSLLTLSFSQLNFSLILFLTFLLIQGLIHGSLTSFERTHTTETADTFPASH